VYNGSTLAASKTLDNILERYDAVRNFAVIDVRITVARVAC
jgi:hypothetical protein